MATIMMYCWRVRDRWARRGGSEREGQSSAGQGQEWQCLEQLGSAGQGQEWQCLEQHGSAGQGQEWQCLRQLDSVQSRIISNKSIRRRRTLESAISDATTNSLVKCICLPECARNCTSAPLNICFPSPLRQPKRGCECSNLSSHFEKQIEHPLGR